MNQLVKATYKGRVEGVDLLFCDSVALPHGPCRSKLHYRLLASRCLEDLAVAMVRASQPGLNL